jgi:hypothetical protein
LYSGSKAAVNDELVHAYDPQAQVSSLLAGRDYALRAVPGGRIGGTTLGGGDPWAIVVDRGRILGARADSVPRDLRLSDAAFLSRGGDPGLWMIEVSEAENAETVQILRIDPTHFSAPTAPVVWSPALDTLGPYSQTVGQGRSICLASTRTSPWASVCGFSGESYKPYLSDGVPLTEG